MFGFSAFAASPFADTGGVAISLAVAEAATVNSSLAVILSAVGSVTESNTLAEALTVIRSINVGVAEVATMIEALDTQGNFNLAAEESATNSDAITVISDFNLAVSESSNMVATMVGNAVFYTMLTESLILEDMPSRNLLWELVTDNQSVNWQNIDTV